MSRVGWVGGRAYYQFSIPLLCYNMTLQSNNSDALLCCCDLVFGVLFYHLGCFLEYKTKLKDTARVVPVHGVW